MYPNIDEHITKHSLIAPPIDPVTTLYINHIGEETKIVILVNCGFFEANEKVFSTIANGGSIDKGDLYVITPNPTNISA